MSAKGFTKAVRTSECLYKNVSVNWSRRRAFASSAICQRQGSVPSFGPTSSPELDALLAQYRSTLFLPAHLSEYDRRLVFRTEHMQALVNDPVKVTIGKEEFRLEHIDVKDQPHKTKAISKALDLMTAPKDWDVLPQLLEGLKDCKRPLPYTMIDKIARRAALANRMDVIVDIVRRVHTTGVRLNQPEFVTTIMWGLQFKAQQSKWSPSETKQALKWAEIVAELQEDERHAGGKPVARTVVIGTLLQLSSMNALVSADGKDADGKVATYALRLASAREYGPMPETGERVRPETPENLEKGLARARNSWLRTAVPILHGMKKALEVLDPISATPPNLREKMLSLEEEVEKCVKALQANPIIGNMSVRYYQELLGSASGE